MPLAPRVTLPLPTEELMRMRDSLSPDYGNELWDKDGTRILVVRVPRDEPDIVNDLEGAVEGISPTDIEGTPHVLLVGHRRTHLLPTNPVRELMASRVRFDRAQCQAIRTTLKAGEHKLWKAPEDPKRLLRLAIRLKLPTITQLGPNEVAAFTNDLGPLLDTPAYQGIQAVYLVADRDDVRIEAGLFVQDTLARHREEKERKQLAEQLVQKEKAAASAAEAERARLMERLEARYGSRSPPASGARRDTPTDRPERPTLTASGPVRRATPVASWEAPAPAGPATPGIASASPAGAAASRPRAIEDLYAAIDAMPEPGTAGRPRPPAPLLGSDVDVPSSPAAPAGPAKPALEPGVAELEARLAQHGYATLRDPGTHGIRLAAERAAFPSRVIAFAPDRLDKPTAENVLAAAKELGAELAVVVCPEADMDARRRFIATRAKWVAPADVPNLMF